MGSREWSGRALPWLVAAVLCAFRAYAQENRELETGTQEPHRESGDPAADLILSYDVEYFDVQAAEEAARKGQPIDLRYLGESHRLFLEPSRLRSRRFRAAAGVLGVERTIYPAPTRCYKGTADGEVGSVVRLSFTPAGIRCSVKSSQGWVFIGPLRAAGKAIGLVAHRVYTDGDLDPGLEWSCDEPLTPPPDSEFGAPAEGLATGTAAAPARGPPEPSAGADQLRILELAVDTDFEYTQAMKARGSDPTVEVESLLNLVDGIYEAELGIQLSLVFLHHWEAEPDPYTSRNSGTLLGELQRHWNGDPSRTSVARDAVHLLTAKRLEGSTAGLAYVPALCNTPWAYALSMDLGGNEALMPILVAHELGHNLGSQHDPSDPSGMQPRYIMYPSLGALNRDQFSDRSHSDIEGYLATTSCLSASAESGTGGSLSQPTAPPSSGGGGGGPVDPLFVLLVLSALLAQKIGARR